MSADEFDAFLECGILAHGFLRLRCGDCGHDKLVAFSCTRRGFCPSCGARRMAQTAAHLVDRALALPPGRSPGTNSPPDCLCPGSLPHVPVRQWVLSLPIPLRLLLAAQPRLVTPVLQGFQPACRCALRSRRSPSARATLPLHHTPALQAAPGHRPGPSPGANSPLDCLRPGPALANECVQTHAAGQVVLKLKTPWRDGTTQLVMSPLEFMQRLAALVPRPRLHLIRLVSA
jgi:hypothetical protein